jgi:hypothetical protein
VTFLGIRAGHHGFFWWRAFVWNLGCGVAPDRGNFTVSLQGNRLFFFHPSIQLFICKLSDDLEPHKPLHGLKHGFAIKKSLVYHHCSPYRENPNSFKPGTLLTGSPWFETNRCYTVIVTMKCIKKRIFLHRKLLIAKAHSSLGATDGRRRCAWGTSSCFLHCCMHHMQIVRSWTERWLCWFFRHILHVFLMLDSLLGSASQLVTW